MFPTSREGHRSAIERRNLGGHSISCGRPLRVLWHRRDLLWIPQPPAKIPTQLWQNEWDNGDTGRYVHLILPKVKHCGNDQKSCLQRDIAHSQLTLRDLASEPPIVVVVASWEPLCTSQPASPLQAHIIPPSPQTTVNISGGKETSTTHCQEFK
ncbi:hypothetical protein AVEN_127348-1 [Araneus ventricosus]|uniref:Uncharacterized protein n=1 Tax=Araneus ventricosus TaxID=182803 RepID=A0A4Y2I003_ARAVE|nr:hypothetical protein AVEN_127348-1 [Araneus ventricosus]